MRYDADHKQQTRERVLKAAAKALRAEGPHRIGVAAVMAEAGLTHGGFYAHFKSKDDFVAAAVGQMFVEGRARLDRAVEGRTPAEGLAAYLDFYLSAAHRDTRTAGCPLPFLSADAPRLATPSRERFAQGVADLTGRLAQVLAELGRADAEEAAGSMLSEMVGAVALARAEPDPARSDAILARTRTSLQRRLGLELTQ
ncbi:transcriptional regulator [Caulobacter sp. AP07]|uniref:TetR/AcrR family transcriptional regulator n=1 Tax=Caulobacter sp. AP07 TaxID=1144304 RepID=UPI00027211AD|nr:TetR/AcrR family transcriptional regulator [Caulobacter sp. AP07]EJL25271.1 transcriptional regulator [Caulobacter sp. AP07]